MQYWSGHQAHLPCLLHSPSTEAADVCSTQRQSALIVLFSLQIKRLFHLQRDGRPPFCNLHRIFACHTDAQHSRLIPCSLHQCSFMKQAENSLAGQCSHTCEFLHFTQHCCIQYKCAALKPDTLFTAPVLFCEASWKQPCLGH